MQRWSYSARTVTIKNVQGSEYRLRGRGFGERVGGRRPRGEGGGGGGAPAVGDSTCLSDDVSGGHPSFPPPPEWNPCCGKKVGDAIRTSWGVPLSTNRPPLDSCMQSSGAV